MPYIFETNQNLPPDFWEKMYDAWQETDVHNLAYALMWAGPENFPHLHLDAAKDDPHVTPGDHVPFYDAIDDVLFEFYGRRSLSKDTPLTNGDYVQIARDANAVLAEHAKR